jgi:hypothetical protein
MRQCLIEGAERFGWRNRTPKPRSMRDGHYLIGQGVAGAIYTHWRWPAKARVTLSRDGSALVEAGMHDLGTGTYTVMGQVAAEALGLPVEKVTVRLGNTRLPESHAAIGSATMANAGAAVLLAAKAAREKATHTNEVVVTEAKYDPVEEANGNAPLGIILIRLHCVRFRKDAYDFSALLNLGDRDAFVCVHCSPIPRRRLALFTRRLPRWRSIVNSNREAMKRWLTSG